jgi:hypothetical protein
VTCASTQKNTFRSNHIEGVHHYACANAKEWCAQL